MNTRYAIGLDVGDGESALAWIDLKKPRESTRFFHLTPGETRVVTAYAVKEGSDNEHVIGEAALRRPDVHMLNLNFKKRPVLTPGRTPPPMPTADFARLFWREFEQRHRDIARDCTIFVGCPAGWRRDEIAFYQQKLSETLAPHTVTVVPESQSAFIYAYDTAGVPLDVHPILVVDVGSSTIDFTLVDDASEPDNLSFGDQLGGRDIDEALLKRVIATIKDPAALERLGRSWEKRLLLWLCRLTKEAAYGRTELVWPESENQPLTWVVKTCSGILADIDVKALVDRDWRPKLRNEVFAVRESLRTRQPQLVLITGGGSRMPFVWEICHEVFPKARIPSDLSGKSDPSLAVANGLASYGHWRDRVGRFRSQVVSLANSDDVAGVVRNDATAFARRFYRIFYANLYPVLFLPIANEVETGAKAGPLLDAETLYYRMIAWLESTDGAAARDEVVGPLERAIKRELTPKAAELCRKFTLASDALQITIRLPVDLSVHGKTLLGEIVDLYFTLWYKYVGMALVANPVGRFFSRKLVNIANISTRTWAPIAARFYDLVETSVDDMIRVVQKHVSDQLLERAKPIERLLVRP